MARKLKGQGQVLSGSPSASFSNFSPKPIQANRAPTTADTGYEIGQLWADTNGTTMYGLSAVSAGSATWNLLGPGASDVDTLTGDGGGAISPAGGNITLAGGTNITTAGAGSTITFNLDAAISLATSVTSPLYTSSAADVLIQPGGVNDVVARLGDAAGATFFRVQDSTSADVFTVDSLGAIALTNASNTGTFTTAGGTASINASSNFNTVINSGTSTGTVTIGNAAAGAITIDTAAGISLDSATASNFTVTGAADLTLASSAGSIVVTGGEAAADAISLDATNGAGGVTIAAGTGGLLFGNQADCTTIDLGNLAPTASRTITVGGGTVVTAAVTDTIDIGPDGATTNANSIKTVNVNTGGVTTGQVLTNVATGAITSGTHTVSIQTGNAAAGTVALNMSTGTGTKTVSLGNADANTTFNVDAVTLINDSVNANTSINTGTSTGTVTIGAIANTGAIAIATSSTLDLDAAGALSLNSTGAAINIGNDADAFAINIGTGAAARTVTIGNTTGASSVVVDVGTGAASFGASATAHTTTIGSTTGASATVIQAGTGEITVTGTVKEINAEFLEASGIEISTISSNPVMSTAADTGGAATGTTGATNLMAMQNGIIMEQFILGAGQTIIAPRMDANGLLISLDLTAAEGAEYNFGPRNLSPVAFTIGTSAAFFFEVGLYINDMDGADPYVIGFRKVEANNATFGNYTDYAAIGMIASTSPTNIVTVDELNSGGQNITNTTDAWGGDGTTNTLRVLVSAAGVVTYTVNGSPPSAAGAITFDNGDVVMPFIRLTHSASATEVDITSIKCGFQA